MSDLLLVGQAPEGDDGKEFFLHCMDWWIEMAQAIEACVDEAYPFDEVFYRDALLAPVTPHLTGDEAKQLAAQLEKGLESGQLQSALRSIIASYLMEDDDELEDRMEERTEQLVAFVKFLDVCGGCRAKWYGIDD